MATKCIVRIIDAQRGLHVDLYHHYDGYVNQNVGVAFDICNTFYDTDKKALVFPQYFDQLVNKFLKGEVGDNDMGYEYISYEMLDIEYIYTIKYDNNGVELSAQEVEHNLETNELETTITYTQKELTDLYRRGAGLTTPITDEQVNKVLNLFTDLDWSKERYTSLLQGLYNTSTCRDLTEEQGKDLVNILQSNLTLK